MSEIVHFGVKGMKWGVRKERTPQQQLATIEKKINRIDANRALEGLSFQGGVLKKQAAKETKKNPGFKFSKLSQEEQVRRKEAAFRKIQRRVILQGAAETALLVGGINLAVKAVGATGQAKRGAQVSSLILGGKAGQMVISDVMDIRAGRRLQRLQRDRDAIRKSLGR